MQLGKLLLFILIPFLVLDCAKPLHHRFVVNGELEKLSDSYRLNRDELNGKLFHFVRGIEDVAGGDSAPVWAIPGFHIDFGLVRAELLKDELRFYAVGEPNVRPGYERIVAAYEILDNYDVQRDINDFGETTNHTVIKRDRPWNQRQYIYVNWENLLNKGGKIVTQLHFFLELIEESSRQIGGISRDKGYISFLTESRVYDKVTSSFADPIQVKFRTHLMPYKGSIDFKAHEYTFEDFQKFGYFLMFENYNDPEKGPLDSTQRKVARIFNICEPGTGRSCSTNQIRYVLNKGFPKRYLDLAQRAIEEWNEVFKKQLGRMDDVIVLDMNDRRDISDPRVNMIAVFGSDVPNNSGIVGVSQTVGNPKTGETVSARATVYAQGLRKRRGDVDFFIDLILNSNNTQPFSNYSPYTLGRKISAEDFLNQANTLRKNLTFSQPTIEYSHSIGVKELISMVEEVAGKFKVTGDPLINKKRFMKNYPEFFSLPKSDYSLLTKNGHGEGGILLKERGHPYNSFLGLEGLHILAQDETPYAGIDREQRLQLGEMGFLQKQDVTMANMGIHTSEFIDEAILRYIERYVQRYGIANLNGARNIIKDHVERDVFYSLLLHELGHNFGLRHNFYGSADKEHYTDEYYRTIEGLNRGDFRLHPLDLDTMAYSSIMDYESSFYSHGAGLGPYDSAAIKYGYLSNIDKRSDPIVKANFKFCTDHQVGEDLLCNRYDQGSTVSEVIWNLIDRYKKNYLRTHFRNDRLNYERLLGRFINTLIIRYMLPIRRVMDEFMFKMYIENIGFVEKSIASKEVINLYDSEEIESAGIDFSNMNTLYKALIKNNEYLVNPSGYIPGGFADMIFANELAFKFFIDVLGTPEPGVFVAEQLKDGTNQLTRLGFGRSIDEQLLNLAEHRGIEDVDNFIHSHRNRIIQLEPGLSAKKLFSTYNPLSERLESMGYIYDKVSAEIALGVRDLGVLKYNRANFNGNAYFWPISEKIVLGLFNKLITQDSRISTIDVTTSDGKTEKYFVQAGLSLATQIQAILIGLIDFVSYENSSFADKMRVCDIVDKERCLDSGYGSVEFVTSSGQGLFKAAQTRSSDSIAYALVSRGVELSKTHADLLDKIENGDKYITEQKMKLTEVQKINEQLNEAINFAISDFNLGTDLKNIKNYLTSEELPENEEEKSAWLAASGAMENLDKSKPLTFSENIKHIQKQYFESYKIVYVLKRRDISSNFPLPITAEMYVNSLDDILKYMRQSQESILTPMIETSEVLLAPYRIDSVERSMRSIEGDLTLIRQFMEMLNLN